MANRPLDRQIVICLSGRLRRLFFLLMAVSLGGWALIGTSPRVSADGPAPRQVDTVVRPSRGALVICGGGRLPGSVHDRFMELAGGPRARIVVVPTAGSDAVLRDVAASLDLWRSRGATSVHLLHTRSRVEADDPAFSRLLNEATGVWLGGGNQSRLSESYVDTEVERRLKGVLDRGGVIGGTSAGAAIMTRVMIVGGRARAIAGRGFDLLPGSVVDQHFLKRDRLGRLLGLLEAHPDLVGFGIDEGTALVLRGDRLSVVGDSCVVACMPAAPDRTNRQVIHHPGDEFAPPWLRTSIDVVASSSTPGPAASTLQVTQVPELAASTR